MENINSKNQWTQKDQEQFNKYSWMHWKRNPKEVLFNKRLFRIESKGLVQEIQRIKRENCKINRRAKLLREKFSIPYSVEWFNHPDGNKYQLYSGRITFDDYKLSERFRHLILARGFILGIPYKQIEKKVQDPNILTQNISSIQNVVNDLVSSEWDLNEKYRRHCILERYKGSLKHDSTDLIAQALKIWLTTQ